MRVLIFGGTGMLGHKLVQELSEEFDVWFTVRGAAETLQRYGFFDIDRSVSRINVEDPAAVRRAIERVNPDVVINAAGVIKQLPTANDVIQTLTINSIFPHRLARLASEFGYRLVCISTDCVFDGVKGNYTESDVPNAYDLYGKSKNLGEVTEGNAITLRTSIIGRELGTAHSLVDWFIRNRGGTVKGFQKAIYSGFPTQVLAGIIRDLIVEHRDLSGLYHVSSDPINKFELLSLINEKFGLGIDIIPESEFSIDRSLDSSRFRAATGFVPPPWTDMIDAMAADTTPYDQWKQLNS